MGRFTVKISAVDELEERIRVLNARSFRSISELAEAVQTFGMAVKHTLGALVPFSRSIVRWKLYARLLALGCPTWAASLVANHLPGFIVPWIGQRLMPVDVLKSPPQDDKDG